MALSDDGAAGSGGKAGDTGEGRALALPPAAVWAARALAAAGALVALVWMVMPGAGFGVARPAAAPVHKRIPVYYWHMWSGQWLPVMNQVVADFNASQDKYEVIALQVPPTDGDQKFLLATAGAQPPDVMAQWTPAITAWAQAGVLQPLDTMMTPAERQYFLHGTYPTIHENGWYHGHLYGAVESFDVYACYYRPSQWRAAGLDPDRFPATLEQLSAEASRLNRVGPSGQLERVGFLPTLYPRYVPSFGGGFYDPATGRVEIDTPRNLAALRYIVDADRKLGFGHVTRFNAGLGSEEGTTWSFITGQTAVVLDGEWRVLQMSKYAPNLDYRVAPLPPPRGGVPLAGYSVCNYLTIPAGAREPAGAWAFIKFWQGLDDPATAAKFNISFGWLPNSPRMAGAPAYRAFLSAHPQYRAFVRMAASPHIATLPPVPYSVLLDDRITAIDQEAEAGGVTAEQALRLLATDVERERARRKELRYAE